MRALVGLLLTFVISLFAESTPPSPYRFPGETAEDAALRSGSLPAGFIVSRTDLSAVEAAVPVNLLKLSSAPEWKDLAEIEKSFVRLRDERFLDDPQQPKFPRRSTWLYPQDGCFARAALMGSRLEALGKNRPMKLFVFGELSVQTPNSPLGKVTWWYHVVPVVKDQWGITYVFDPAVDAHGPMFFGDWLKQMGDPASMKAALCHAKTYGPGSSCDSPSPLDDSSAENDQRNLLTFEWNNLLKLSRNPDLELGEFPPWAKFSSHRALQYRR